MLIVQKIVPEAQLPTRSHPDDVGLDLYSIESVAIPPLTARKIHTGIKIMPGLGRWMQVESRSGLGEKGISVLGGIIDPSYRGEVGVILVNHTAIQYNVKAGDKIAQMVERPAYYSDVYEGPVDETERGEKGFGSSGR
jgi:dUTP pyrophosphatase